MQVEVFKTNVRRHDDARMLIDQIQKTFSEYTANFDLQDCDKILRVISVDRSINSSLLIGLLKKFGFEAQVLPDDKPVDEIMHWQY